MSSAAPVWLKDALGVLNEREMKIIEERRLSEDGATLEALGETLGISKERVRQIENRALEKLKSALIKQGSGFLRLHAVLSQFRRKPVPLSWNCPSCNHLSVMILTLSPADTVAPGASAFSTRNSSSLRSTPTIVAAIEPTVWPGFTVTTRILSGFSAAFSRADSSLKLPPTVCADGVELSRLPWARRSAAGRPGRRP